LNQGCSDYLIDALVISALYQYIGLYLLEQLLGCAFAERNDPIHRAQAGQHRHSTIDSIDRPARPLQAGYGCVIVHSYNQAIAQCTCLLKISYMTSMEDIEAAIGENDFLAMGTCILNSNLQLLQSQYPSLRAFLSLHSTAKLRGADCSSAQLTHYDTCSKVRQSNRVVQLLACSQRGRQGRNNGIARAGYVEDLPCTSRQVERLLVRPQQRHPVFTTGYQQRTQLKLSDQFAAFGDQISFVGAGSYNRLEFA